VERIELHLLVVFSGMQSIEVGHTVNAEHHGLAIDNELLHAVLQRSLGDPWIALGPVVAVAGDQPHAIAVALDAQAIAVIFDFVKPVRARWNLYSSGRHAELKGLKHVPQISICRSFANLLPRNGVQNAIPR